ncbi:LysR family transcriptional regulator [Spirochaeta cellobiosiphila]|uniref:LysR family transcriptional regulator n=1 Tax=Spirochaeta cellobiosiphila TaxID=504483 RepID=UPI001B7F84B3|nr:LysR family transcriptional regulator [Spirochaeta cellobiosiphila]
MMLLNRQSDRNNVIFVIMDIYRLSSFIAVAEQGSIHKAAINLNSTVSTISGHIKLLEEELGIVLFTRQSRGMRLTDSGKRILLRAREIISSTNKLYAEASLITNTITGDLIIGINAPIDCLRLSEVIKELDDSSHIRIMLKNLSSGKVIDGLQNNELDGGFLFENPNISSLNLTALDVKKLVFVLPHRFKKDKELSWEEMSRLTWICSDGYCPHQEITESLFKKKGLSLNKKIFIEQEETKLSLIQKGVGPALLLEDEVKALIDNNYLVQWSLPSDIYSQLYFATRNNNINDPKIKLFMHSLMKQFV